MDKTPEWTEKEKRIVEKAEKLRDAGKLGPCLTIQEMLERSNYTG